MMYQFNGRKMYEGNKSLLFFLRKTFKIQSCYFSNFMQGSSGSEDKQQ
jgi:hypothetical protein